MMSTNHEAARCVSICNLSLLLPLCWIQNSSSALYT